MHRLCHVVLRTSAACYPGSPSALLTSCLPGYTGQEGGSLRRRQCVHLRHREAPGSGCHPCDGLRLHRLQCASISCSSCCCCSRVYPLTCFITSQTLRRGVDNAVAARLHEAVAAMACNLVQDSKPWPDHEQVMGWAEDGHAMQSMRRTASPGKSWPTSSTSRSLSAAPSRTTTAVTTAYNLPGPAAAMFTSLRSLCSQQSACMASYARSCVAKPEAGSMGQSLLCLMGRPVLCRQALLGRGLRPGCGHPRRHPERN